MRRSPDHLKRFLVLLSGNDAALQYLREVLAGKKMGTPNSFIACVPRPASRRDACRGGLPLQKPALQARLTCQPDSRLFLSRAGFTV